MRKKQKLIKFTGKIEKITLLCKVRISHERLLIFYSTSKNYTLNITFSKTSIKTGMSRKYIGAELIAARVCLHDFFISSSCS